MKTLLVCVVLCLVRASSSKSLPNFQNVFGRPLPRDVPRTPAGTYHLATNFRKGVRAPSQQLIRQNHAGYSPLIPFHIPLFTPFYAFPHLQFVPVRTVFYAQPTAIRFLSADYKDGDRKMQENDKEDTGNHITIAHFPTQIGPAFATRTGHDPLVFAAPGGIVQSSQPSFEKLPFRNSKISSHLLRTAL